MAGSYFKVEIGCLFAVVTELTESCPFLFILEHNFFDKQPIVNASVFYLRTVLHDWPDAFAADILLRLRDAATPSTSLVIADYILAYACTDTTKAGSLSNCSNILAPPPLLANLGRANSIVYTVDLNVRPMELCILIN